MLSTLYYFVLKGKLITARKRSLGQGKIFAPVCHSVHRGWYPSMHCRCIGGSRGGREGCTPPPGHPNSFDFMQFSGKFGVFTPPPRENPGSATEMVFQHALQMVSQHALQQVWGGWYLSMPFRFPGPHPGRGGSLGGSFGGGLQAYTQGQT